MNLVTGATGFIGSHLSRVLLERGEPVRVLCRPGSEPKLDQVIAGGADVVRGDLRDHASLVAATRGVTRVFHCAGHVSDWGSDETFRAANVDGTRALLEASAAAGVARFVHLSSIAVFGTPAPPRFDDDAPYGDSRDGYSRTKVEGEKVALSFHREGRMPVTVLRPAVVYGPGGAWLEEPLSMIEQGRMFLLGGGEGTCHPCYIGNLVDAMRLAATHPDAPGQAFIVGDGESIPFRAYFDAVAALAGKPPIRRSIPLSAARVVASGFTLAARLTKSERRPLLTATAIAMVTTKSEMSIAKIRRVLGWQPRWTFAQAFDDLRAWYAARQPRRG